MLCGGETSVILVREHGIATVTLNRPDRLNALDRPMWPRLERAFRALALDDSVRCVVLRGAGRAFSPGADIAEFAEHRADPDAAAAYGREMDHTYEAIRDCPHPVVAALRGPCTGAGFILALLADLRIAAEDARLGAPVARIGLAMPYPEFRVLYAAAGPAKALEIVLEARLLDAREAFASGLVNRVVPLDAFEAEVAETTARIAAGAPLVHRWHKAFARRLAEGGPLAKSEIHESYASFGTDDYHEGYRAFLEKRAPAFQGL